MMTSPLLRAALLALIAGLAAVSYGQTQNEVYYNVTHDERTQPLPADSFTTGAPGSYTWTAHDNSWFIVTGDGYDTPTPWRLLFKHLANNSWANSKTFTQNLTGSSKITSIEYYYTETGKEVFVPGVAASNASRDLTDLVNEEFDWVYGDYEGGGGNPPDQP